MDRHQFEHDEQLISETRAQFSILTRAVLAEDPAATKRLTDALGEYIADDNACAELVRALLMNPQVAQAMLGDLIWDEAGELAKVEVAQAEQRRAESADDNRIAQALAARMH